MSDQDSVNLSHQDADIYGRSLGNGAARSDDAFSPTLGDVNVVVANPQTDSIIDFDANAMKSQMALIKRKQSMRAAFLDQPRADGAFDADMGGNDYHPEPVSSLSDAKFKKKSSDFDPLDMKNKKPNASRRKSTSNYMNEFKVERASKPRVGPIDENRRPSESNRISPTKRADKSNVAKVVARSGADRGVSNDDKGRPAHAPQPPRREVPSSSRPSAIVASGAPRRKPVDRLSSSPPRHVELSQDDSISSVANERAMQDRADNVIGALRRRKQKRVPLFMKIEAEYLKKASEIEQEKMNAYNLMQYKKKLANPSAKELAEHMQKYEEVRMREESKKAQRAAKRKDEWRQAQAQLEDKIDSALPNIPAPSPIRPPPLRNKYSPSLVKDHFNDALWTDDDVSSLGDDAASSVSSLQGNRRRRRSKARPVAPIDPLPEDMGLLMPSVVSPARISPRGRSNLRKKKANIISDPYSADVVMVASTDRSGDSHSPRSRVKFGANVKFDDGAASMRSHLSGASSKRSSSNSTPGVFKGQVWISQLLETDDGEADLARMYETGFEMHMVEKGLIEGPETSAVLSNDL